MPASGGGKTARVTRACLPCFDYSLDWGLVADVKRPAVGTESCRGVSCRSAGGTHAGVGSCTRVRAGDSGLRGVVRD